MLNGQRVFLVPGSHYLSHIVLAVLDGGVMIGEEGSDVVEFVVI